MKQRGAGEHFGATLIAARRHSAVARDGRHIRSPTVGRVATARSRERRRDNFGEHYNLSSWPIAENLSNVAATNVH